MIRWILYEQNHSADVIVGRSSRLPVEAPTLIPYVTPGWMQTLGGSNPFPSEPGDRSARIRYTKVLLSVWRMILGFRSPSQDPGSVEVSVARGILWCFSYSFR